MSRVAGASPERPPPLRLLRLLRLLLAGSAAALFWACVGGLVHSLALYGRLPFRADPLLGARESAARRDLPAALRQYELAQTLSPGESRIAIEHGNLLASNGRFDAAADRFQYALARSPDSPGALAGLGDARLGQGRPGEAAALYAQVLEQAPGHAGVGRALAEARRRAAR